MSSALRSPWRTVGLRLTVYYAVYIMVSVLLVLALAYVILSTSLEGKDREAILDELGEMSALYRRGRLAAVQEYLALQQASERTERFVIRILAADGTVVFVWRSPQLAAFDPESLHELPRVPAGQWRRHAGAGDPAAVLDMGSAALDDGGVVEVGSSTQERDDVLTTFRRAGLLALVVVLGLGASGGALLAASALRPIRHLVGAMRAAAGGEMRTRLAPRRSGDELDELIQLFNSLLDRIATLVDGMRGAVDNVAHELRTPIMRMRGMAELALRAPDAETLRHAVAECVEELDQLLAMLNTVMDISEAEAGALKLRLEPVDVSVVVGEMVELYQLVAQDKGVALSCTADADLGLTADRSRLRQVIGNLLDNAIKYTAAKGTVDVRATRDERGVVIGIRDSGCGIPSHELARIWDRLYRGGAGRGQPGLGLGLSLVRAIVGAHGGHVDVSSAEGVGSEFSVVFPPGPAHEPPRRGADHLSKV
jgi:signal transduction histidine kinase